MCNLTDRVRLVTLGMLAAGLLVLALGVARLPAAGLAELFAAGPGSVLQHDAHAAFDADDPVLAALEGAFREQGIAGALRQLSALSAAQPDLRPLEHHYVFEVARLSYAQTQDAAESFRQCGAVADTGCYHGVMDAFVAATPWLARDDIAQLCDGAPVTARTPVLRIQCVHGVGHGLARVARWNGQTSGAHIFSVAQHTLLVECVMREQVPRVDTSFRLAALLHDAPEYVIGDMISPFKAVIGGDYKVVERRLLSAIHVRFGLPAVLADEITQQIKAADRGAAYLEATRLAGFSEAEARRLFGRDPGLPDTTEREYLTPWTAAKAEKQFLARFAGLVR